MKTNNKDEKTLALISKLILWIGLAGAAVLLLVAGYMFIEWENETAVTLLLIGIPVGCSAVISWSILNVICKISLTLTDINNTKNN